MLQIEVTHISVRNEFRRAVEMRNRSDLRNLSLCLALCLLNCICISCNGRDTILPSSYHLVNSIKNVSSDDGGEILNINFSDEDNGLDSSYVIDTAKNEFSRLNVLEEYSIPLLYSEIDLRSKGTNDTILSSSYHLVNSIKNESSDDGGETLNINFADTSQDNRLDSSYVIDTPKNEFSRLNFLGEYSIPLLYSEIDLTPKGQDDTILSSSYHVGNSIKNEPLDDGGKRLNMNRSDASQDSGLDSSYAHNEFSRLDVQEKFTPQPSKGREIIITNIFESMDISDNLPAKTSINPMHIVSQHLKVRTHVMDKDPIRKQSSVFSLKGKENMVSTASSVLGRFTALPTPRFKNASLTKKSNTSKDYPIPTKILSTTQRYTHPRITNTTSFKMNIKSSGSSIKKFLHLSVLQTLVSKSHSTNIDEKQRSPDKTSSNAFKTLAQASRFSEIITVSVSTNVNASVNGTLPDFVANNHASLLVGAIFIPGLLVLYLTCRFLVPMAYEFSSEKC